MKHIILTTVSLVLLSSSYNAQEITVKEITESFKIGSQNALSVTIYETNIDKVTKEWTSYLKNRKAETVSESKKEFFGDNVLFVELGNNPVDVYSKLKEEKSNRSVVLTSAFDLGGAYLNSSDHADKYKAIEKMLHDFSYTISKEAIAEQLKTEEKSFNKLKGKQEDLEGDKRDLEKDIENYESKIKNAESEIRITEIDLIKKKSEVDIQRKIVETSAGAVEEQAKSAKKIYDKLLDQQKGLEKKKTNLSDDIKSYTKKISKAKDAIYKNEKKQSKSKALVDEKQKIVNELNNKQGKLK